MLRHLGREDFQERMRVRNPRTAVEGVGGMSIVFQVHVVHKSQVVVEAPLVGIIANAKLQQRDGAIGPAGSVWWRGRQKISSELVCDDKMGIQTGGDFQER